MFNIDDNVKDAINKMTEELKNSKEEIKNNGDELKNINEKINDSLKKQKEAFDMLNNREELVKEACKTARVKYLINLSDDEFRNIATMNPVPDDKKNIFNILKQSLNERINFHRGQYQTNLDSCDILNKEKEKLLSTLKNNDEKKGETIDEFRKNFNTPIGVLESTRKYFADSLAKSNDKDDADKVGYCFNMIQMFEIFNYDYKIYKEYFETNDAEKFIDVIDIINNVISGKKSYDDLKDSEKYDIKVLIDQLKEINKKMGLNNNSLNQTQQAQQAQPQAQQAQPQAQQAQPQAQQAQPQAQNAVPVPHPYMQQTQQKTAKENNSFAPEFETAIKNDLESYKDPGNISTTKENLNYSSIYGYRVANSRKFTYTPKVGEYIDAYNKAGKMNLLRITSGTASIGLVVGAVAITVVGGPVGLVSMATLGAVGLAAFPTLVTARNVWGAKAIKQFREGIDRINANYTNDNKIILHQMKNGGFAYFNSKGHELTDKELLESGVTTLVDQTFNSKSGSITITPRNIDLFWARFCRPGINKKHLGKNPNEDAIKKAEDNITNISKADAGNELLRLREEFRNSVDLRGYRNMNPTEISSYVVDILGKDLVNYDSLNGEQKARVDYEVQMIRNVVDRPRTFEEQNLLLYYDEKIRNNNNCARR